MTRIGRRRPHDSTPRDNSESDVALDGLHWLAAGLFLAAGTEAGLGERRGDHRAADEAVRWGPLLAAPLAGAAHAARILFPGAASRTATRVLDGLAVAVGSAGVAAAVYSAVRDEDPDRGPFGSRRRLSQRLPSAAPLTFAFAGLLGVLLDREERIMAAELEETRVQLDRAQRRANVIERLMPERKRKFDRVVVHI